MPLFGNKKKKTDPVDAIEKGNTPPPDNETLVEPPPTEEPPQAEDVEPQETEDGVETGDELADEYGEVLLEEDSTTSNESLLSDLSGVEWDPDRQHLFGGFESETSWGDSGTDGENEAFEVGYDPIQLSHNESWLLGQSGENPILFRNADFVHRIKFIQPLNEEEIFSDLAVGLDNDEYQDWRDEPQPEDFEVQFVTEWSDNLVSQQVVPEFQKVRTVKWPVDYAKIPHVHSKRFGWRPGMQDFYAKPKELLEIMMGNKMVVLKEASKVSSQKSKKKEESKKSARSKRKDESKKEEEESKKREKSKKGEKKAAESDIKSQKKEGSKKGARKTPSN